MSYLGGKVNRLLKKIKRRRDEASKAELFALVGGHLITVASLYAKDRQSVDDIVVNAVLRAFERIDSFDESKDGYNWLCKIVQNEAYKMNSKAQGLFLEDVPEQAVEELSFDRIETSDVIQRYLSTLTERERQIIYYSFWEEKSSREIGAIMGVSKTAINNTIKKALRKFKK